MNRVLLNLANGMKIVCGDVRLGGARGSRAVFGGPPKTSGKFHKCAARPAKGKSLLVLSAGRRAWHASRVLHRSRQRAAI